MALAAFREIYRHRDKAAREWRAGGGKVVGTIGNNVPDALIAAAGFLPYRLSGDPHAGWDALEKYLYPTVRKSVAGARQINLEFANSILQLIFSGRYDFVDYLVVPYARKSILHFHTHLTDAKRLYPDLPLPQHTILDRTLTANFESSVYNRARLLEFRQVLEGWAGRTISDDDLARQVALGNQTRSLLQQVAALRKERRLSGTDALAVIGSGKLMPRERYTELLRSLLARSGELPILGGKGLFVAGSPLDNSELYALIESCGAIVTGENHYWGNPSFELEFAGDLPPFEAIADHHHKSPPDIVYPLADAISSCQRRAHESGAEGAIFSVFRSDDPQLFTTPDEIAGLAACGIKSLYLKEQPYRLVETDGLKATIEAFIATLQSA
jgi:benzoyl-CoA reductase/2-hydroxyglutaryl-CoA dehydratase subunit BcrC/BadD/HgdB